MTSVENSTCGPATTRAVGSGLATARYWATSSPNTIDTDVAISSASANARPPATSGGQRHRREDRLQQTRHQRLGEIAGDQRGDRDAHLGARELERQRAVRPLHELVAAPAGAGVRVDRAALQRGQRELGGDEHRRACGEHDEAPAARARCTTTLIASSPGLRRAVLPGRLGEGSASERLRRSRRSSWRAARPGSPTRSGASTGACGTGSLSRGRHDECPMLAVSAARRPHQPVGSGWPSANPAADCTPSTTLSWSSAMVAAPT